MVALLRALENGEPAYGYQLCASTGYKSGSIYPALRRLQEEKLIRATWEIQGPGPIQKHYQITNIGKEELRAVD